LRFQSSPQLPLVVRELVDRVGEPEAADVEPVGRRPADDTAPVVREVRVALLVELLPLLGGVHQWLVALEVLELLLDVGSSVRELLVELRHPLEGLLGCRHRHPPQM
jgi:hypothetical protein